MCGIVGYVGKQDAAPILLQGLQRLEYRGYDSAGVAVIKNETLRVHKAAGPVRELINSVPKKVTGPVGIAHTRWATHGPANDVNAHPHTDADAKVAVVHNGIIENAAELRLELAAMDVEPVSDTDTELLAHLIAMSDAPTLEEKVRSVLGRVSGTYGLLVIDTRTPDRLIVARNGSPIVLGIGAHEMLVASDVAALVKYTTQVVHLDDGEMAVLTPSGYTTTTLDRIPVTKEPTEVDADMADYGRGGYEHYLRREIADQPEAIRGTLRGRLDSRLATTRLGGLDLDARELRQIRRVKILGCGSAYYSGLVGADMIESLARIPASAEPASEFRYRNPVIDPETLYVAVSQSGETVDTLAAVEEVMRKGGRVLGVVNVVGSSIARACGQGVYLHAGPEVSVASTKAFTSTCVAFAQIALHLGRIRDLAPSEGDRMIAGLEKLADQVEAVLEDETTAVRAAERIIEGKSCFYVGRVRGYPVALEGAQKLKELSYVHAEAYPASELKHGPLALIEPAMPTVVIAPDDHLHEKNVSTIEQIKARGGPVIAVGHRDLGQWADETLIVPRNEPELDPILLNIPLQIVSYHAAIKLGRDIDQPRNLAKSVTVE